MAISYYTTSPHLDTHFPQVPNNEEEYQAKQRNIYNFGNLYEPTKVKMNVLKYFGCFLIVVCFKKSKHWESFSFKQFHSYLFPHRP